jgi:hypothetical protein
MHTGGREWGGRGMKQYPSKQIKKTPIKKNAIKPKIGGPLLAIFPESLDTPPPSNFGKNFKYPSLDF